MASGLRIGLLLCVIASAAECRAQAGRELDEAQLERSLAANPKDARLHRDYAIFLEQQGRTAEAIAHFRAVCDLNPDSADDAYNLSLALLHNNLPADALAALDKHPVNTADSYALRGAILNALNRSRDAAQALRRAVALDGANPDTLYDLAITLLKIDENAEAAALLERGRRSFPTVAKMHAGAGMVAYLTGRNADAVRAYETAVKLEPNAADLFAALGDVYDATGDLPRAEKAYLRALRLDSSVAAYHVKYARNLLKLQRPKEAEAAFLNAVERDPANPEAQYQLGKLAAARDDHSAAIARYQRAVASMPSLKEAWYQLSLSYRRTGNEEQARAALEQFRKLQ